MKNCFFCDIQKENENLVIESDNFFAMLDNFPISKGHSLIIPKNHIGSFFTLNDLELKELYDLIKQVKAIINEKYRPDGWNLGINEGRAAGQSIDHLHIHLIPRYLGDVSDPHGGVRNIIHSKGDYRNEAKKMGREQYIND